MPGMDAWDWALVVAAAYVLITTLARLMRTRREQLIDELSKQVELEQKRQAAERKRDRRRNFRSRLRAGGDQSDAA